MASLKAEKPALAAPQAAQSKKEPKATQAAPKASASKSNSASKKAAQKSQDLPKKVLRNSNKYMIL